MFSLEKHWAGARFLFSRMPKAAAKKRKSVLSVRNM